MKWVVGVVVVVLLLFVAAMIGHEVFARRAQARLNAALVPVGSPLSIAELRRAPPPPEDNAALLLRAIGPDLRAFKEQLTEHSAIDDLYGTGKLTDAQSKAFAELFAARAPLLKKLRQAAARPNSDQLYDYTLLPSDFPGDTHIGADLAAARILAAHSAFARHEGRVTDAIESIATMLRIAGHRDREPLTINHLVAAIIRHMAFGTTQELLVRHQIPSAGLNPLTAALAASDDPGCYQRVVITERAFMLDELRHPQSPGIIGVSHAWQLHRQAQYAELSQQVLAALARPDPGRFTMSVTNPPADLEDTIGTMVDSLKAHCEDLARIRVLRCAIAIAQQDDGVKRQVVFRQDQQPTADDLAQSPQPIVLNDQWLDPFDGQPLRVKHTPAGWLIYSIGKDLTDNGGHLASDAQFALPNDLGLGPLKIQVATP